MIDTAAQVYNSLRQKTAPGLLCELAANRPRDIAYRAKQLGIYRERTWNDYAEKVARCAAAFEKLGLGPGETVAIMGDPCENWMICDLAAQALGCVTYGIYPTASLDELRYQMQDGGAVLFVAEDQEYVDKILEVAGDLKVLRHIVVVDATTMFAINDARVRSLNVLTQVEAADLKWLKDRSDRLDPDSPAFIVYTSGTTGAPKGAVLSHGKHLAATYNIVTHYPVLSEKEQRAVVFLPLCHVLGRDIAITLPMMSKLVPHFGEDTDQLATTIFEVAPTVLFSVPRYLQKFASQILIGISSTTGVKRKAYDVAMRLARNAVNARWDGTMSTGQSMANKVAWLLVFRPILNKLGFDKLELVISGGAPLPPETATLWQVYGLNLVEMYGQTETTGGIVAGQRGPFARPGTVGTVPEGWKVRLADDGEILVYSPDLFDGYWNDDEASRNAFTDDGWLRTGDVGEWKGDDLRLIDRARDFLVTSGGKTISPSYIEGIMQASPYISEIMVVGNGRKYLTALIEIDFDMVADWARNNSISYTGFTNLAQNPGTRDLIAKEIAEGNSKLARVEQIKDFRILYKELDPEEEGEPVTATRKVKRNLMLEKFKDLVEEMYDDQEERMLAEALG